jgi:hypothetical protein
MQPTYLPWMGYFGLMDSVDTFVLLDNVAMAKRSWQQRNQIKTASGPVLLTIPVLTKGRSDQLINEALVDSSSKFGENHWKSIEQAYRKAPFFASFTEALQPNVLSRPAKLVDLTVPIIKQLREQLGIRTPLLLASEIECSGRKADLLASLCKAIGGTHYVSAPGSLDYLATSQSFTEIGIKVSIFNFTHPSYAQLHGNFLSHMSVIDLQANLGAESLSVIRSGYGEEMPLENFAHA